MLFNTSGWWFDTTLVTQSEQPGTCTEDVNGEDTRKIIDKIKQKGCYHGKGCWRDYWQIHEATRGGWGPIF